MGEYIRFLGKEVKIGTCENLYYATLEQFKDLLDKGMICGTDGAHYLTPSNGYRWRFPFPDEDHAKEFCDYHNCQFDRGVMFKVPDDVLFIHHLRYFFRTDCDFSTNGAPAICIEIDCPTLNRSNEKHKVYDWSNVQTSTVFEVVQQKMEFDCDGNEVVRTVVRCPYCKAVCVLDKDEEARLINYVDQHQERFSDLQKDIIRVIGKYI